MKMKDKKDEIMNPKRGEQVQSHTDRDGPQWGQTCPRGDNLTIRIRGSRPDLTIRSLVNWDTSSGRFQSIHIVSFKQKQQKKCNND